MHYDIVYVVAEARSARPGDIIFDYRDIFVPLVWHTLKPVTGLIAGIPSALQDS